MGAQVYVFPTRTIETFGETKIMIQYRDFLSAAGRGKDTITKRMRHLEMIEEFSGKPLLEVTTSDLEKFLAHKLETLSNAYVRTIRVSFVVFYRWAVRREYLLRDPSLDLAPIRVPRPLPRPVPEAELMFAYYQSEDIARAMISLGAMAGLRISEIAHAHMDDRENNTLRVLGKGGKMRLVPLNEQVVADLQLLESTQRYGYYFANPLRGFAPYSTFYIGEQVCKFLPKKYTTHTLRHRAASIAYASTKDLRAVQEFLGHSDISTTQIYTAVTSDALLAVGDATGFKMAG